MSIIEHPDIPTPEHSKAKEQDSPSTLARRQFLSRVCYATGGLIAVAIGVPAAGMFIGPMLQQVPALWQPIAPVDKFAVGSTTQVMFVNTSPVPWTGETAQTGAWLRRDSETQFTAFAVNCTHLGCPVRWEQTAQLFLCPCHGGAYYSDGSVAAGPPPHALRKYPVRISKDGNVEIQTSPLIGDTVT